MAEVSAKINMWTPTGKVEGSDFPRYLEMWPSKSFQTKKCLKGNEIRRDQGKSIFAMLLEAEKWWEREEERRWLIISLEKLFLFSSKLWIQHCAVKINNSKAIFYHVDAKMKLSAFSLMLQPKMVSNNHVSMFYKYPILNKLSLGSMFSVYPIALNINWIGICIHPYAS